MRPRPIYRRAADYLSRQVLEDRSAELRARADRIMALIEARCPRAQRPVSLTPTQPSAPMRVDDGS